MAPSFWQILIVLVLIVLLFGRGKISDLMGDVAKGIKSFRKGLKEDEGDSAEHAREQRTIVNESEKPHDSVSTGQKQETPRA